MLSWCKVRTFFEFAKSFPVFAPRHSPPQAPQTAPKSTTHSIIRPISDRIRPAAPTVKRQNKRVRRHIRNKNIASTTSAIVSGMESIYYGMRDLVGCMPARLIRFDFRQAVNKNSVVYTTRFSLRSEADSNRCTRFCRPLPSHSAIRPIFPSAHRPLHISCFVFCTFPASSSASFPASYPAPLGLQI